MTTIVIALMCELATHRFVVRKHSQRQINGEMNKTMTLLISKKKNKTVCKAKGAT